MTRAHRALTGALILTALGLVLATGVSGQGTPPPSPLVMLAPNGRGTLPTAMVAGQEMVALDDLAGVFGLAVREERVTNSVRVTYRDKAILLTFDQTLVSVEGRLVSLPAPLTRAGGRSLVPVEFVNRAFGLVYEEPVELRKASRLLIVGRLRVPRVTVRYETRDSAQRIILDIAPTTGHAIVQESGRLLVRLEADALDTELAAPPGDGLLAGVGVLDAGTIAFALGPRFESYRASIASSTPAASRLVVDLLAIAPEVSAAPPPVPGGDPPPFLSAPRPQISTIVIDPGHGGNDQGAHSATGAVTEKEITLAVARQLRRAIETRFGMRVLQTRDDDRRVGSDERAAYANNAKADLFISLHANASPQPTVRGAEVMYLELDRYGDEARRQAQLEGAWLPVFGGDSREIELVPWDLAQARHVERSGVLARIAERALGDRIEVGRRGVQQGPIRVLIGVNMPAVLIEMGYLTNLEEAQALASSAHQADIVQALTDTIGAFRDFLQSGAASTAGTGVPAPAVDRVARRP
jgi:N-acetylmuramoyl-L-alanine amidase